MNIEQKIQDAIKQQLPSEVGNVLRERLNLIDELESKNESLNKLLNETREKLENANDTCASHKSIDDRNRELEEREKSVLEREINQSLIEQQKQSETEKVQLVKEMFTTVFRNTTVRKTALRNNPEYCYGSQGEQTGVAFGNENIETTEE